MKKNFYVIFCQWHVFIILQGARGEHDRTRNPVTICCRKWSFAPDTRDVSTIHQDTFQTFSTFSFWIAEGLLFRRVLICLQKGKNRCLLFGTFRGRSPAPKNQFNWALMAAVTLKKDNWLCFTYLQLLQHPCPPPPAKKASPVQLVDILCLNDNQSYNVIEGSIIWTKCELDLYELKVR